MDPSCHRCRRRPYVHPSLAANLGVFPVLSRTSPVIYEDTAIVGTMQAVYGGHAFWLAVRTSDGSLVSAPAADRGRPSARGSRAGPGRYNKAAAAGPRLPAPRVCPCAFHRTCLAAPAAATAPSDRRQKPLPTRPKPLPLSLSGVGPQG